jgi:hypothetical protein
LYSSVLNTEANSEGQRPARIALHSTAARKTIDMLGGCIHASMTRPSPQASATMSALNR